MPATSRVELEQLLEDIKEARHSGWAYINHLEMRRRKILIEYLETTGEIKKER